ncbi:M13 family metallopeptidase [Fulvivirga maritima]|uniref:M13 family metallopeptidase N-terminal domain-containing protein n=1 Tax=Fulvivirga maritima TaxID=2904247 RepID=UPI001F1DEB6D|nr:M13 family metallopeptidase N-terminal domain-containing protein [Fulvivirga maritima]UII25971.1 M13 family metallopeptidase [Fulvivirga maritima]
MKKIVYASVIVGTLLSCGKQDPKEITEVKKQFVAVDGIDNSIKPGDNFFRYVNGIWYDTAQIADDQVGVGSYMFLNIPQKKRLEGILEDVSSHEYPEGSVEQKVGDFYASGMDTTVINKRGYQPIQPILDDIESIQNESELLTFVAKEIKTGNSSIIRFGVYPNTENSSINILHFGQSGLGLPDRDYYFKTDSSTIEIQSAYKEYIKTLFELTGSDADVAKKQADEVYGIEKELAAAHKTRIERREIKSNYHNMTVAEADAKYPNLALAKILQDLELETDTIDMAQLEYFEKLNSMLPSVSLSGWKTYLKAHTLSEYANILSEPFENAAFSYSKVISGQSTQKPLKQRMVEKTDRMLGFALGQLYVEKYFSEEAKKRALELVENIKKSLDHRITKLEWMSDSTKIKAKEKLQAITQKSRIS